MNTSTTTTTDINADLNLAIDYAIILGSTVNLAGVECFIQRSREETGYVFQAIPVAADDNRIVSANSIALMVEVATEIYSAAEVVEAAPVVEAPKAARRPRLTLVKGLPAETPAALDAKISEIKAEIKEVAAQLAATPAVETKAEVILSEKEAASVAGIVSYKKLHLLPSDAKSAALRVRLTGSGNGKGGMTQLEVAGDVAVMSFKNGEQLTVKWDGNAWA